MGVISAMSLDDKEIKEILKWNTGKYVYTFALSEDRNLHPHSSSVVVFYSILHYLQGFRSVYKPLVCVHMTNSTK